VYCIKCWWSDDWDPKDFAREFDFSRSFFDQWSELRSTVPQSAMQSDDGVGSVNCEYCAEAAFSKNCYFFVGSWQSENAYYSSESSDHSRYICDCTFVSHSELAYWCTDSRKLYNCCFLQNSDNCHDCQFGYNLIGCKDCIGCVGLRQKRFCIFNEELPEEEYRKKLSEYALDSWSGQQSLKKAFGEWSLKFPRRAMHLVQCENCRGDNVFNSKNTYGFSTYNAENCKFFDRGDSPRNSYDVFQTGHNDWCYEGMVPDDSYMALFTSYCWKDKYVMYSDNCHSSNNLFGCISMRRAEYCIFNKRYSPEEYHKLMASVIEHMVKAGEWGEFFPMQISSYRYNETTAQDYFPLTKAEALGRGCTWADPDPRDYQPATANVPDRIDDVSDDIVDAVLACESCKRNYRLITLEMDLYRRMKVPVPRCCYDCRHLQRAALRTPYKLWSRKCGKCEKPIETAFSPDRLEIVHCDDCYLEALY
jgi:hypothetical protein